MSEDEGRISRKPVHELGEVLDALSLHELDERITLLRAEIERLEQAISRKRGALDAAGSIFGPRGTP